MSDKKNVIDDAKTKAGEWIDKPENQKQIGGWIAQLWAWITGDKK